MDNQTTATVRVAEGEDDMTDEDTRPAPPADPEHDDLIALGEDLPTDEEEFAAPPEPEARTTPDTPS